MQSASGIPIPVAITVEITLRALRSDDGERLAAYFEGLSPSTTSRFQPHPLTREEAMARCGEPPGPATRLVLERGADIVGYFILEAGLRSGDAARYAEQGIMLEVGRDLLFAPSVADMWQNQGLSSQAMPHLIALSQQLGARSLVLMGGTQATNDRAIRFYEKFGFEGCGGYQSEIWNHDMRLMLDQ